MFLVKIFFSGYNFTMDYELTRDGTARAPNHTIYGGNSKRMWSSLSP